MRYKYRNESNNTLEVIQGDNVEVLKTFRDQTFDLIYIDPPFNTGHTQSRNRASSGAHSGVIPSGVIPPGVISYNDKFDDYMEFLIPRLLESYRLLKTDGSFFLHLDYREVHYAKIALDQIFGRDSFINEIIWSYDYGARSTKRWSTKHDNILWYAKDPNNYCFNFDEMDRIPYMAPDLVGAEKAARGKTPTDVWWNSIVGTNSKEKTGYPTQKPLGILNRIVRIHSDQDDQLLDFFAGSGSFGDAAIQYNRNVILVDSNPDAIDVMRKRFGNLFI